MRKVVVTEFLSLDGVMEAPSWTTSYWNDAIARFKWGELFASDALLLGRVTYQGFAAAWPSQTDDQGFADRMNNLAKYVVTTTLNAGLWNNTHLIRCDATKTIADLKRQDGMDILVGGSATLSQGLLENSLVDQYNLLVYPLVLGKGKKLFKDSPLQSKLKLIESCDFGGVTLLRYAVERA
ncbi:MAG: dihydrofolate reductase family protein [Chloroflexota bacterium]